MGSGRTAGLVFLGGLLLAGTPATWAAGVAFSAGGIRATKRVRSFHEIRQAHVVRQRWDLSCGSAALSTLLTYHLGKPTPETAVIVWILRRTDPVRIRSRGGFSLLDLKRFAQSRGYSSKGYADLSLKKLMEFGMPALVPIRLKGYDHFVVFRGVVGDRVLLADPAYGNLSMRVRRFVKIWKNGIGFIVLPQRSTSIRGGLAPRREELLVPAISAIGRAVRGGGPAQPSRRGP